MMRPEVVEYLREHLKQFPIDALRRQLYEEGVSDIDFEHCLAEALRSPKLTSHTQTKRLRPGGNAAKFLLAGGLALIIAVGLFALSQKPAAPPLASTPTTTNSTGESGFVGAHGWVVRLPKDYEGHSEFKDASKNDEIVYFAKHGTDPTSLLDEGLYGQLGIVRVEVAPSPFPPNPTGAAALASAVSKQTTAHGEKFLIKNIQIATLPGVQVNVQSPFPRVEAYVLGQNDLYFFYAGQEDDVWRDIVLSLRDAHSEN